MAGTTLRLFFRRDFDFGGLPLGATAAFAVEGNVDVSAFRTGTLLVRVHDEAIPTGHVLRVRLYATAPSVEDPLLDFVTTSAVMTASSPPAAPSVCPVIDFVEPTMMS